MKNYWIFTHIHQDAEKNFKKLIEHRSWQFSRKAHIYQVRKGDIVLFYVSDRGKNVRYFAGKATISGAIHSPTRPPVGDGKRAGYEVSFNNVAVWKYGKHLTNTLKQRLYFIKKAPNVGLAFKDKPMIPINEHDYNLISDGMIKAKEIKLPIEIKSKQKKSKEYPKSIGQQVVLKPITILLTCLILLALIILLVCNIKFISDFVGALFAFIFIIMLIAGFCYIVYLLLCFLSKILS